MSSSVPSKWVCSHCARSFSAWNSYCRHRRWCKPPSDSTTLVASLNDHDDVVASAVDNVVVPQVDIGNDGLEFAVFFEDEVDDYVPPEAVSDSDDDDDEFSEDIALFVHDGVALRYRSKFLHWGYSEDGSGPYTTGSEHPYSLPQLVTLRFLLALETGDPLSYNRQQVLLANARVMGGDALLLHPNIHHHWSYVAAAHELLTQSRGLRQTSFPIPTAVQQLLGLDAPTSVPFQCEDIVLTLVRLLLLNPFNKEENVQLLYEDSDFYDDYCNGDRWKRVLAACSKGSLALFFTLFIDGLQQDKGGFVTAKGCVLTMANFRWFLRDASCAKAGICVFPDVNVPKSYAKKDIVLAWKQQLFHDCIAFVLKPAHEFNRHGGALLPLHNTIYHFERVVLLALITDAPEGRDLGGTIGACHHCFCPKKNMGDVTAATQPRTTANVKCLSRHFSDIIAARVLGTVVDARTQANTLGLKLSLRNGFDKPLWAAFGIFGPDELVDHIHGALPQGMLHGMHEGLVKYMIKALLMTAIESCIRRDVFRLVPINYVAPESGKHVRDGNRKCALDYIDDKMRQFTSTNSRCSDVELLSIGSWEYFPKGVTDGLVGAKDKRLNGMYYWPMLRQIHVILAGSNLLTRSEKIQLFGTCDLCYQVLEGIHNPVSKTNDGAAVFQTLATEFARSLIVSWKLHSKSNCESIKWHLILHWSWFLKEMGAFSDERTLEKELGILFKKPYKLTNHRDDHNEQMANRSTLRQVIVVCTCITVALCPSLFTYVHVAALGSLHTCRGRRHGITVLEWYDCEGSFGASFGGT
jgi:hypothetical protein